MSLTYRNLQIRRGNKAAIPVLQDGEPGFCEDTHELFIGTPGGNKLLGYIAMNPSNWATPPTSLADAVDRLAAVIVAHFGGNIP